TLWTVAELITPRPSATTGAHLIRQFRVSVRGFEIAIKRTKIRPYPGRRTLGNGENRRELRRCDFAGQRPIGPLSPRSIRIDICTTSSDSYPRRVTVLRSVGLFVVAAVAEIGGAWMIWQGGREHRAW